MKIPEKKYNIAEYLLYMWQIEDLLRAYSLDIDLIQKSIIDPVYETERERSNARNWYEGLVMMMKSEGVQERGHLQINKNIIIELTDLHLRILKDSTESEYIGVYYNTLPYIVELRSKAANKDVVELETCFTALYGYLLLKVQKKEISKETQAAVTQITALLRLLSKKYREMDMQEQNIV
ncbi:MAG TPA: DUF4924 family protein [Bacteroidales bacterium]|nr:DUF4924 family protein [Bacteroidales bacterium]